VHGYGFQLVWFVVDNNEAKIGVTVRILCLLLLCAANLHAEESRVPIPDHQDLVYKSIDGIDLKLDLYLSPSQHPTPCIVFVHGGGWRNGSKASARKNAVWLTEHGFAVAAINYRLTDVARWPAQIDDCYSAVRWVRQHAESYGIDPDRVGALGTSAGAHLVALMGTRVYPGREETSSRVQAVCDWFGPTDLLTMPPNNVGDGRTEEDIAKSNGAKLLGATVRDVPDLARDASGLDHVSEDDAAFLIMHGDMDTGVPLEQSAKIHAALVAHGVPSQFHVLPGAGHGGKPFHTEVNHARVVAFFQRHLLSNWHQGPGPGGNFRVRHANSPVEWSVVRSDGIAWEKTLPETGQSSVACWGDRVFFTTLKPVEQDSELGNDIVAYCCDANTGQTIWTREIAASHPLRLSGCFSDSSAPSPVTDGRNVVFFNASGRIACFNFEGELKWQHEVMPVGRTQPVLIDGNVVFIKQTYMPDEHGHFTNEHGNAPRDQWTQLQAVNIDSGKDTWNSTCGVNMGCVPLPMTLSDGRRVMIVGRGGGHSPPERPEGVSMIDAGSGETIWTLPLKDFMSTMTFSSRGDDVFVFDQGDHLWVDAMTGEIRRRESFIKDVTVRHFDEVTASWDTRIETIDTGKKTRAIIQSSNLLVGKYHFFRSYTKPWLGRVDVESGQIEFLQLPVQLRRDTSNDDAYLWSPRGLSEVEIEAAMASQRKRPKTLPIQLWTFRPNDMKNSRGHLVMGDPRSRGNGWGHHASQIPTVVGKQLYIPVMNGTVYVIRWDAKHLDEKAIVAINDLGPVGESFHRASLSFANGKLFAHTIQAIVCIGESD
ncbi:MAG: alpha/beta hydrolase fold domain-containing protein, partial [Planctomycetota bacterium]